MVPRSRTRTTKLHPSSDTADSYHILLVLSILLSILMIFLQCFERAGRSFTSSELLTCDLVQKLSTASVQSQVHDLVRYITVFSMYSIPLLHCGEPTTILVICSRFRKGTDSVGVCARFDGISDLRRSR